MIRAKEFKPQTEDGRNIIADYFGWQTEHIKADLDSKRLNYSILCQNLLVDLNVSTMIRSSNIFLAKEVIIFGRKRFDRRGMVGAQNYTDFRHVREVEDLDQILSEFDLIIGIDNIPGAIDKNSYRWDPGKKTLICFGNENVGLCEELIERCNDIVYIKQYGCLRSLNVASAAAIIMDSYCSQVLI